jgi:hypothetical protein
MVGKNNKTLAHHTLYLPTIPYICPPYPISAHHTPYICPPYSLYLPTILPISAHHTPYICPPYSTQYIENFGVFGT